MHRQRSTQICVSKPHLGTSRKSVDINAPRKDELEMLLPFELDGLTEADPEMNPRPRITLGESAVVESGTESRPTTSTGVGSTFGDVGVCDTVNAVVGGAESDNTLVSELELLLATLSGLVGTVAMILKGACNEFPVELGDRELESLRYCKK